MNPLEKEVWYAMYVSYRREMKVKEILDGNGIVNFIPMRYTIKVKNRRKVKELTPVIHNLIFICTTATIIRQLKEEIPYLQYMTNQRLGEKIIVPDNQMRMFIAVTGTYDEQLIYLKQEEINLKKGCRVRIKGGDLEGYEGIFMKVKGSRNRRVVVVVEGVIAVAMATLPMEIIEVLPDKDAPAASSGDISDYPPPETIIQ